MPLPILLDWASKPKSLMVDDESSRIDQNLTVIRAYLVRSFAGFDFTEDKSTQGASHTFTVSNRITGEDFRLQVAWDRLAQLSNTPDRTTRALEHGGVAGKMRSANGGYFYWRLRI